MSEEKTIPRILRLLFSAEEPATIRTGTGSVPRPQLASTVFSVVVSCFHVCSTAGSHFDSWSRRFMEQIYDMHVDCLVRALALHDAETEAHARRAASMMLGLARAYGFPQNNLANLYRGALLHDIGKIGIPHDVLLKTTTLTADECATIRRHPGNAYELLYPLEYIRPALTIPYCHHEKWDGSGYPRGLKGMDIPLEARLFAVIDVWDALTSNRPYRPAMTKEQARKYIYQQSGKYFQPEVVNVFFNKFLPAQNILRNDFHEFISNELNFSPNAGLG